MKSIKQAYPQLEKAINVLIDKNIQKVSNIKNEKIPEKFEKIEKHKANIKYNQNKIIKLQLKVKTCKNIKEYFHSFSIKEPELRHDKFINCLKTIHDSLKFKLENKLHKLINLLDRLNEKLEINRYLQSQIGDNKKLDYLKTQEKSYLNKISKQENKIQKIKTKLEKYETLSKGIQGIEAEPPANKSQHIEEMMSKNESFNNSLNGIVVNLANLSNLSKLSESFIADRVVLSNAVIISDLNIDISRDQAEKTAATMENISDEKNSEKTQQANISDEKNSEKTQQANISDEKNSEKTQRRNKSIEKQSVQSVNKTNKKSLLGELHNNQQKLSDNPGKTVDLNKSITKAPEVSL